MSKIEIFYYVIYIPVAIPDGYQPSFVLLFLFQIGQIIFPRRESKKIKDWASTEDILSNNIIIGAENFVTKDQLYLSMYLLLD